MMTTSYFPTGIVTGTAFCNREKERELLKKQLAQNAHVVLISPRRYGKSSLIAQFTSDRALPFASVDLLPATSSKYVKNAIVDGVSHLMNDIMPKLKKTQEKILSLFSNMNPVIELSAFGQKMKLTPQEKTPQETIMKLLLNLDKAAGALNKKLIFVIDEFQQISNLEDSHSLEASIRHAVERSQHVFYVFSGSNRTLLEAMFKNKERPLYHLCDEMRLNRIDKEAYTHFIERASKNNWKSGMSVDSIAEILFLTECHPYYVNRLCRILWDSKTAPNKEEVEKTWEEYVNVQKSDWITDVIAGLSINQRAVLATLAKEPESVIGSKDFVIKLAMSLSSIQRTMSTLEKKDFIFKDQKGRYSVLNPVIKSYLLNDRYFD